MATRGHCGFNRFQLSLYVKKGVERIELLVSFSHQRIGGEHDEVERAIGGGAGSGGVGQVAQEAKPRHQPVAGRCDSILPRDRPALQIAVEQQQTIGVFVQPRPERLATHRGVERLAQLEGGGAVGVRFAVVGFALDAAQRGEGGTLGKHVALVRGDEHPIIGHANGEVDSHQVLQASSDKL